MSKLKIVDPSIFIIEKTAGELCGVFFDAARSSGLTVIQLQGQKINLLKYKRTRDFARAHFEKFIPAAVHALIEIMSKDTTPVATKELIYQAIMERTNDQQLDMMGKSAQLPEYENTILYKKDNELPKPVIVNTPKINFDFDSKRTK